MTLAIYVFRKGEVRPLDDNDSLKVISAAFASGFTTALLKNQRVDVTYGNISGEFDISVQEAD